MEKAKTNKKKYFPFKIIKPIAKGGMGEVLLAFDTINQRKVALKTIREDLKEKPSIYKRFLREASIASGLAHPNIIPIYSINLDKKATFYTMPYIEGKTLKDLLVEIHKQEKEFGGTHSEDSIRSLMRIFLTVCEAIAYAHVQGVIHRDLKPENILVGKYGEVLIFDWGVAKKLIPDIESKEFIDEERFEETSEVELTRPGKIVGTLPFMAPERIFSKPASVLTDIYALGVMLFLILTLRLPFKRKSLKTARNNLHRESWPNPVKLAPYRDIPHMLIRIAKKSLQPNPQKRYQCVEELIKDIKQYVEGRSEWFLLSELFIENKDHWQFHENILLPKHIAISDDKEAMEWVSMQIAKESFEGNAKIEANIKIGPGGSGISFLINSPELSQKAYGHGYRLCLSVKGDSESKLYRDNVEVLNLPEIALTCNEWHSIRIEKVDNNLYFYLDDELKFSYISYLPLMGTHVGLIYKDANFEIRDFSVFVASPNILVSCLAVPDALLFHKAYEKAILEYRRIGNSFPGRHEGREAIFRAGVTLIEQAKNTAKRQDAIKLYNQASDEFETLRKTPGAPLEYLGKALVYESQNDNIEELKCLELGIRKYLHHPLSSLLFDHIIYRLHQSSQFIRKNTFRFALLVTQHIPIDKLSYESQKLIKNLAQSNDLLYFLEDLPKKQETEFNIQADLNIKLSISLANKRTLVEVFEKLLNQDKPSQQLLYNILFGLKVTSQIDSKITSLIDKTYKNTKNLDDILVIIKNTDLEISLKHLLMNTEQKITTRQAKVLRYLFEQALMNNNFDLIKKTTSIQPLKKLTSLPILNSESYLLASYLLQKKYNKAKEIFKKNDIHLEKNEENLMFFFYGCWLNALKGEKFAFAHFSKILELPLPPYWALGTLFLTDRLGSIKEFEKKALPFEKYELFKQLYIYYASSGEKKTANKYLKLWRGVFK